MTQFKAKEAKGKHGETSVIETGSYQTYQSIGWIPACACYGIALPGKLELPDKPDDCAEPFFCEACGGTGKSGALTLFGDAPCPECGGVGQTEGDAAWQAWNAETEAVLENQRLALAEIEALNLPTVPCVVLDPFMGSGTTLAVAQEHGRSAIGIELNPKYIALAEKRIAQHGIRLPFEALL